MIITKDNKMADVIHLNYSTLTVLNRFEIALGFGDKTIEDICRQHQVDLDFFLEIINTFVNEDYFPKKHLQSFSITLINDYLKKTHDYYHQVKVPEIENLMEQMVNNCYTQKSNLTLLKKFFNDYKQELKNHTQREDEVVFPYTLAIEKAFLSEKTERKTIKLMEEYSIDVFEREHDNIEEKLFDLKNIIIKYLPQPKNFELCNKLLNELFTLEQDLNDHARIEDKVLVPKVREMERVIRKRFSEK
ncbi:MAG TPA: hemerythrin domain-containing protein [Bacteroidales bacterium]|nr:hemerythrin domain-containing protein [Bacteroidales bacterium]